jgi:hypothetical protein
MPGPNNPHKLMLYSFRVGSPNKGGRNGREGWGGGWWGGLGGPKKRKEKKRLESLSFLVVGKLSHGCRKLKTLHI